MEKTLVKILTHFLMENKRRRQHKNTCNTPLLPDSRSEEEEE
jgi:hypothetical protein